MYSTTVHSRPSAGAAPPLLTSASAWPQPPCYWPGRGRPGRAGGEREDLPVPEQQRVEPRKVHVLDGGGRVHGEGGGYAGLPNAGFIRV